MFASICTGARLHVIVMHLARHAYRKYFNHTGELQRNKSAQPSEYLPPIGTSFHGIGASVHDRGVERSLAASGAADMSVSLKGESSMKHMRQVWYTKGMLLCSYRSGSTYWILLLELFRLLGIFFRAVGALPIYSNVQHIMEPVQYSKQYHPNSSRQNQCAMMWQNNT